MNFLVFPIRYLKLRDEDDSLAIWRDFIFVFLWTVFLVSLFTFGKSANFFGASGFVDKIGSLSSSLTGFYIAGLLAVASFSSSNSSLDEEIENGKAYIDHDEDGNPIFITRREYICYIFGYSAFLSLSISLISALYQAVSPSVFYVFNFTKSCLGYTMYVDQWISAIGKIIYCVILGHLAITTCYGLYYLIHRMYAKQKRILPKDSSDN